MAEGRRPVPRIRQQENNNGFSLEGTMLAEDIYAIMLFSSLILVVPGPSNTLLLSAGFHFGSLRAAPFILLEALGYSLSISAWGWVLARLSESNPWIISLTKALCALYVALLAVKTWNASIRSAGTGNFRRWPLHLFVATLSNPKALIFASVIFPGKAFLDFWNNYTISLLAFLVVLAPIGMLWVGLGAGIRKGYLGSISGPLFSKVTSVILALFSASLTYTMVRAA
ncbi:TPA: LysE family translocator [Pseudomonas aeruginosa]